MGVEHCDKDNQEQLVSASDIREERIIQSWHGNARPWIHAVRQGKIQTRVDVTDQAILNAITAQSPRTVLDLGCGEGWLSRTLASRGIDVTGVDAVEELLESARQKGAGRYLCLKYQDLSPDKFLQSFDLVVCNFSLFGEDSVEHIFRQAPSLLNQHGTLLVQTLHPLYAGNAAHDLDGWRAGSWKGFDSDFSDPAPWYFRTPDSWRQLFEKYGFELAVIEEPISKADKQPVSLLMMGRKK